MYNFESRIIAGEGGMNLEQSWEISYPKIWRNLISRKSVEIWRNPDVKFEEISNLYKYVESKI